MVIDNKVLDELTARAKASPRLRQNFDLRNTPEDQSQRMLNALEPGTIMPIHRHRTSSETVTCVRGHFVEHFYDENGTVTDTFDMVPGGLVINVPKGQWHNLESMESGTILLEAKNGKWEPLGEEDILKKMNDMEDIVAWLKEFMENEGRSCSMDFGCITPEYVYRMWGGKVPLEEIAQAMMMLTKPKGA